MIRTIFTRKNLIAIAITVFYAIVLLFTGMCLDGGATFVNKKNPIAGKKAVTEKGVGSGNDGKTAMKPEKIAFSFTADANLNDGGETAGNVPYVWVSKASMVRCALTYGDTVIVQSMKEGSRILASECL